MPIVPRKKMMRYIHIKRHKIAVGFVKNKPNSPLLTQGKNISKKRCRIDAACWIIGADQCNRACLWPDSSINRSAIWKQAAIIITINIIINIKKNKKIKKIIKKLKLLKKKIKKKKK